MTDVHHCRTNYHADPHRQCYAIHGCQCAGCKMENTNYTRKRRALPPIALPSERPVPGSRSYSRGRGW